MAAWSVDPIWKLPVVSMGVFEGERSNAKAMAKELSVLWETMDINASLRSGGGGGAKNRRDAGAKGGGRTKTKTLRSKRRNKDF